MMTQTLPACPRCGEALASVTPGGRNPERLAVTVLSCTNPAGCIGPLARDFAPGGAPATPASADVPAELVAHTRESSEVRGLLLEFDGGQGLTFRYGTWFTVYSLADGRAIALDCSDRGDAPAAAYQVAGRVARSYAAKLASKAVA